MKGSDITPATIELKPSENSVNANQDEAGFGRSRKIMMLAVFALSGILSRLISPDTVGTDKTIAKIENRYITSSDNMLLRNFHVRFQVTQGMRRFFAALLDFGSKSVRTKRMRCFGLIFVCFLTSCFSSIKSNKSLESVVLPNTQILKIHSKFTKQNYHIYVNVPASYIKNSRRQYPTIVTLDADYSFAIAKQIVEHLSNRHRLPEMFIFGIAYEDSSQYKLHRTRDYTPTHVDSGGYGSEYDKHSGGGPAFAGFIEKELFPYLNEHFRLSNQKVLIGHSYGGLFASWLMLTKPESFSGYIVVSPSLWYDNEMIFKLQESVLASGKSMPANVFFAIGSKENGGDHKMVDEFEDFIAKFKSKKPVGLMLKAQVFQEEDHDTIFPAAITRGLMNID